MDKETVPYFDLKKNTKAFAGMFKALIESSTQFQVKMIEENQSGPCQFNLNPVWQYQKTIYDNKLCSNKGKADEIHWNQIVFP